jgi:hypothetical protein
LLTDNSATIAVAIETETEGVTAEGRAHLATEVPDRRAVRERSTPIPQAEITENENERTGTRLAEIGEAEEREAKREGAKEEERESGTVTAALLDAMLDETTMTDHRAEIEICLMIDAGVVEEGGETAETETVDLAMGLVETGSRVLHLHPRRRSQRQT